MQEDVPLVAKPQDLLHVIGENMVKIAQIGPNNSQVRTKFHTKGGTNASFPAYLQSKSSLIRGIYTFMQCSNSCYILAMIFLDRIKQKDHNYAICTKNLHKLFVTAVLIALKTTDDKVNTQLYYARVAGMKLSELNDLQLQFLSIIEFRTYVSSNEYMKFANALEETIVVNEKPQDQNQESQIIEIKGISASQIAQKKEQTIFKDSKKSLD